MFTPTAFFRLACALAAIGFGLVRPAAADTVVGSGHVISETRTVSNFHGVELGGSGNVVITQGDTEGLVIEAEDNLLPLIESKVDASGVLQLGFKKHEGSIQSSQEVIYKVTANRIERLDIAGSGSMTMAGLAADRLDFGVHGSGGLTVDNLHGGAVGGAIEGSGTAKLTGEVREQTVTITGSGEYKAKDLKTESASVVVNGSGEGEIWASGTLKVVINGSGEVNYYGTPTVSQTVHGSGEVHSRGEKHD